MNWNLIFNALKVIQYGESKLILKNACDIRLIRLKAFSALQL